MILVASIGLARTLGLAHARALFLFLVLLAVGACAQLDRLPAVAVADTDRASVTGISEARFLSSDTAAMAAFGRRLYERQSKYFSSLGRPIPPESLLAISGGGDNGAFGAGVLVGWSESGTRPSFKIVTGISTGALIAPLAFVGPEYDPLLSQMYTTIDQTDVFEKRPLLEGLVSDALADTRPLQSLIAKYVDAQLVERIAEEYRRGRALVIITTDLDAGVPVIWNIGAIAESGRPEAMGLIRKILLASASVPGLPKPCRSGRDTGGPLRSVQLIMKVSPSTRQRTSTRPASTDNAPYLPAVALMILCCDPLAIPTNLSGLTIYSVHTLPSEVVLCLR
jgi:Patatin-like phospholipase